MDGQGLWKIELYNTHGGTIYVLAQEDLAREALAEWRAYALAPDGTGSALIEVHGMTDTADRAEMTTCLRLQDLWGVSIFRMY